MHEPPKPGAATRADWRDGWAILNLRGRPDDTRFLAATGVALGVTPPVEACRTVEAGGMRIVWAGPDDWFVLAPGGRADLLGARLRAELAGVHAAVTDVSSGYAVLRLSGSSVRDALAQGCPLDLHPREFGPGCAAGTHFYKASVWLWQVDTEPVFEMLVRRSFMNYVRLMLQRSTLETGLVMSPEQSPPGR